MTKITTSLSQGTSHPTQWSAVQARHFLSTGAISAFELLQSYCERIKQRNPLIKAFVSLDEELVLSHSKKINVKNIDSQQHTPLLGIPIGIKDVIDTADFPTQMGSPIYAGARSLGDGAVVSQLRAAGGMIIGKTATCEFAGMAPAATLNPLNNAHTPGGSSSGSAAALADFMVPLALGTQTGGSIIRPSSFCGLIGYKPTFNSINRQGLKFAAESFDTIGVMARAIEDIHLTAEVLMNIKITSAHTQLRHPPRIGICKSSSWSRADGQSTYALAYAAERASAAGADVRELNLPAEYDELAALREIVNNVERSRSLHWEATTHGAQLSPQMQDAVAKGRASAQNDYIKALQTLMHLAFNIDQLLASFDFILTPAVNGAAPLGLHHTGDPSFQAQWTCLHVPTLTLPCIKNAHHLPIGIQLVAPRYHDADLLAGAQWMIDQAGLDGHHIHTSQH
jgi:Asp-tRNA(Asn)/Glu-tRNA(Gln) amidotransferase A subunit family amidase